MEYLKNNYGLKVGFWNVNGLSREKTSDDYFQKHIQLFDIIFLSETWHEEGSGDQMHHPNGYLYESIFRKNKKRKGRSTTKKNIKIVYQFLKDRLKISFGSK